MRNSSPSVDSGGLFSLHLYYKLRQTSLCFTTKVKNMKNITPTAQKVYDYLRTIPKGKVVTYGQIAEHLGNKKMCRAVGNILHANPLPDYYPCYKVVNTQGKLAQNFGLGIEEQKRRLEKDGIKVVDYRVDLKVFQWN